MLLIQIFKKMHTKLKLKIELHNRFIRNGMVRYPIYDLKITCLEKDKRFESKNTTSLRYESIKSFFYINSIYSLKEGLINNNSFNLPSINKLKIPLIYSFQTDNERKNYLKKLYVSLDEWSNYWEEFTFDSNSNIIVNDNIWKIQCERTTI